MSQYEEGSFSPQAHILMLQMQVEQLEAQLIEEIERHKKASHRASMAEKRCQKLKAQTDDMEGDLRILAECCACVDFGKKDRCKKCANSAVFVWNGTSYEWRGLTKNKEVQH